MLTNCRKTVTRSDLFGSGSASGASSGSTTGGTIINSQPTVTVAPVNCSISTVFPAYWRNHASETFAFSCVHTQGKVLNPVECQIDNGSWASCNSNTTFTLNSLSEGAHQFRIRATSSEDSSSGMSAYVSWGVDLTSPTLTPPSLVSSTNTTASFSWGGTDTGGSNLAKYRCKLSRTYTQWEDCNPPNQYMGLSSATGHTFYVKAVDYAGNESAQGTVNFTTMTNSASFDGCLFTSPVAPYTNLRTQTFGFYCNQPGGTIANVECRLDSGAWASCDSQTSHIASNLGEGQHLFSIRYADTLGNRGQPASISWQVNSIIPVVDITSAQTSTLTPGFLFSGRDSAGGPLASFQCQLSRQGSVIINWTACNSPITFSSGILPTQSHVFKVKGFDFAGNESLPAAYTWTAPNTQPPSCVVQSSFPSGFRKNSSETILFTCSSAIPLASYECQVNGQPWAPCSTSSSHTLTGLQSGTPYHFFVRATDVVGNVGNASLDLVWTTDLTIPTVTINSSSAANSSLTVQFTAADTGGSGIDQSLCTLDGVSGWAPCTSPITYTGLATNTNFVFRVKTYDRAGNVSTEATTNLTTVPTYVGAACSLVPPASISSGWTAQTVLTFQIACSGAPLPSGFECQLNSGTWNSCTSPFSITTPSSGAQVLSMRPIDSHSLRGPVDQVSWQVDTTIPDLVLSSASTGNSTATFTFTATDTGGSGIANTQCQISGVSGWSTCTSPKDYMGLTAGTNYTFSVRATDRAGNESAIRSFSWTTPTSTPAPNVTPPPAPNPPTPIWSQSAYGGYYDATGRIQGALRLPQMRTYGGNFASGEAIPMYAVLVNSYGHVCFQGGYMSAAFAVCIGLPVHYE